MLNNNTHKRVHILVSGFTSNYGGVETFLFEHYKHMDHNRIQVDFLTHVKKPAFHDDIEAMGGRFFYIPVRNKYPLKYRKELREFFQNHAKDYDAFWCNKCMLNNIDFLRYATMYHIPVRILHSHNSSNMDVGLKGKLMELMHKYNQNKVESYVTKYWACSDYAAKWLFPSTIYEKKEYTFIPNAVDAIKFRTNETIRATMRAELGMEDNYVIGHIGRFNYQKNHEFLIRIFSKIYTMNPKARLLLIGSGELEESVKQQVYQLNLDKVVQFLGVRHDISEVMQAMDCFVLPSRFEGLPVVAVEAQAAGLPCVMAKDGITEQVQIIDSIKFMQLSQTEDEWAKEILKLQHRKMDSYQRIKDSGFNIDEAAKHLEEQIRELCS